MNAAVRAAIEARITELDAELTKETQVLTSYEHQLANIQTVVDGTAAYLAQLEEEREELAAALPEEVEE